VRQAGCVGLVALLLAGCTVGPNYKRPVMPVPPQHRFVEGPAQAESLADTPWMGVFSDPVLQDLIRESILANLDLRIAASRVEQARARAGIAKSFLYPTVAGTFGYAGNQGSRNAQPPQANEGDDRTFNNWNLGVQAAWDIDLFGRIRRQNEGAIAVFLSTEQGRRAVLIALVADVSATYFRLRELDLQLEIARRTVGLNDETVTYFSNRLQGGVSNRLEVDQVTANRARTAATIPEIEQDIAITENALSLLLGRVPGPIPRGRALAEQQMPPSVPAGLPAALLERRPDVLAAEQLLVASNADIGAAKALFYPNISLTAGVGGLSGDFTKLLSGGSIIWSVGAGLVQPIFNAGRLKRNYELAQAQYQEAVAQYQKSALNAYREVADALIAIQKLREVRAQREVSTGALRNASQLSRSRYDSGLANYLEILIADERLFTEELLLAQTRGAELRALTDLYRSLGGGWPPPPQP
jgi:multidrug efflux system outer membrane protein